MKKRRNIIYGLFVLILTLSTFNVAYALNENFEWFDGYFEAAPENEETGDWEDVGEFEEQDEGEEAPGVEDGEGREHISLSRV